MNTPSSDALVFFGATGDLAYKKIFPSLQAMVKRGNLKVPVVGVAKAGWNLDQLKARAKDSLEKHGGLDPAAFATLTGLLRYVDGDYKDPATFQALRKELEDAQRPAHYLAIAPLTPENLMRGQFRGYLQEPGVAPNSQFETFAVMKLEIDSWRWHGVPLSIRAGKNLPVTCTEITVRLRQPPTMYRKFDLKPNHFRFRISPEIEVAFAMHGIAPNTDSPAESVEMVFNRQLGEQDMDAYERVLTDAMAGDATLFARQDYVEEAWRIVDPALKAGTPVFAYEPQTWGPKEIERVTPPGGWHNPVRSSRIRGATVGIEDASHHGVLPFFVPPRDET